MTAIDQPLPVLGPTDRTRRLGWHVFGPRTATFGFVAVLVLLAAFLSISGWTVHHQADSIVEQHRFSRYVEEVRLAIFDEEMVGSLADEDPIEDVNQRLDLARQRVEAAVADLRVRTPSSIRPELDEILLRHDRAKIAANGMLAARELDWEQYEVARERFRKSIHAVIDAVEDIGRRYRIEFDEAIGELGATDSRILVTAPIVFALCCLALGLFGFQLRHYRRRVEHQTLHDALTGLPNRHLLTDRTDQALLIARRTGASTALLLIDLDRFKEINDTLGHHYGDLVLAAIGPRLVSRLRDSDTVARLGGDEFGVLLTNLSSPESAVRVAEELAKALREPFRAGELTFDLEGSIGVAVAPDHGTSSAELVQRADIAMYLAKSSQLGVALYQPETDQHSPERLALLGELRHAIDAGQLALYYQPKISVADDRLAGAEALIRWQHPERGLVPPDHFIPLAEHTSLIEPLTTWVITEACRQVRAWAVGGLDLVVAVNVSARSLCDLEFPRHVHRIVRGAGVDPSSIEIEVTETSIMREPERALAVMRDLSELGFSIAIDDFGSGYTSLGYLRTLPVDSLKIDRMFVTDMHRNPSDAVIVRSVVELAHNLGLGVVAEGVEDADTCADLAAMGCGTAQGYFWSRPLPAEQFLTWTNEHRSWVTEP